MLNETIKRNKRQTIIVIAIFIGMIMLFGGVFAFFASGDGSLTTAMQDQNFWSTITMFGIFAGIYVAFRYVTAGYAILKMMKAKPLTESDDPELYHIVGDMALAAHLPTPKLYTVNDPCPNAFATGVSHQKASITVTSGLRQLMNREELEGVIGHEMSHIKNYDIRVNTLTIALAGFIWMLAVLMLKSAQITLFFSHDSDRDSSWVSLAIAAVLGICGLLLMIVAYPIAHLIQLAVSRQRESLADISSVDLTRNPDGLISALRKLETNNTASTIKSNSAALSYFNKPTNVKDLFSTHPPLEKRIAKLEAIRDGKKI